MHGVGVGPDRKHMARHFFGLQVNNDSLVTPRSYCKLPVKILILSPSELTGCAWCSHSSNARYQQAPISDSPIGDKPLGKFGRGFSCERNIFCFADPRLRLSSPLQPPPCSLPRRFYEPHGRAPKCLQMRLSGRSSISNSARSS